MASRHRLCYIGRGGGKFAVRCQRGEVGSALGCIGAGVRAIPIGHTHGQQILARLHGEIEALAEEFAQREPETAGSFCPAYEVLCHAQANLYTRIFRS